MMRYEKNIFDKLGVLLLNLAFFSYLFLFCFELSGQSFSIITKKENPHYGCVQLENPPIGDSIPYKKEDLQVFLFPHNPDNPVPPMLGGWEKEGNNLFFCPMIPFTQSLTYQARFPSLPYFTFKAVAKKNYLQTEILEVYPTIEIFPENNLKMYLYFSAPMSEGNAYQYLRLEDERGKAIETPFLEMTPLLWNEDRTRLTLWFDPGRVKRDLIKNKKLGVPLEEGKNYTLHISKSWKDANGYSLANDFEKKIQVGKADRTAPNPVTWTIISPKTISKEPLVIHFSESLDHALAQKSITIFNEKGGLIKGSIKLKNEDKEWNFTPTNNWLSDKYKIKIDTKLEDLAGNNLNRLFDTDIEKQITPRKNVPFYYLDFRVH